MGFVFYLISAFAVGGALAAVLLKNLVHAALALTVAFLGLALLFLRLDAQFAGFAQILVYVGAVAILVVFAILLTKGSEVQKMGSSRKAGLRALRLQRECSLYSDGRCCRLLLRCQIKRRFQQ